MKPTRRNFLKAVAAFCVAPLAWLLRKPTIITVHNKPQYEGHVPQVILAGESWLFAILADEAISEAQWVAFNNGAFPSMAFIAGDVETRRMGSYCKD